MALLIVIFFFGVLHGLGPDHLAAITVFGSRGGRQLHRLTFFSLRFALGQSALRIMAFTLGIITAMVAYGVLTGAALEKLGSRRNILWQQLSAYGVGVFSLIAGLLTLHEHLG